MPVRTKKSGGKIRVVKSSTGKIEKTPKGNARDGGGFPDTPAGRKRAVAMVRAINQSVRRRRG